MVILSEDPLPKFIEGTVVRVKKRKTEMMVAWHREGTVHCKWWDNGILSEDNFSAFELEPVK